MFAWLDLGMVLESCIPKNPITMFLANSKNMI